ncbi:hypothetical protein [Haliangium ochraceum]|uniref:Lipoprotein n=1 Tax=Haliangium ochraceum (strain DSM 14365 / JCM 11303 / SMP-2) TaxID=502025 RepID=D0LPY7_HALO1|nr:hypothetical protein [Haliangium ochraceum]ACY17024.1 hypothetical protein Hoch_4531 [Haliangium ochraceum DSM 14365]
MKLAVFTIALMMLAGCGPIEPDYPNNKYTLTWYCTSDDGTCERVVELRRYDRASIQNNDLTIWDSQDPGGAIEALIVYSDSLPQHCDRIFYLVFFGHEIEEPRYCGNHYAFEIELSIPDEDPATSSRWVISAAPLD